MSNEPRLRLTFAVMVVFIALSGANAYAQANPYQVVANHFKLPGGRPLGSVAGIDIDRDGSSIIGHGLELIR